MPIPAIMMCIAARKVEGHDALSMKQAGTMMAVATTYRAAISVNGSA